ncbi:hypothetical protein [Paraflavitalea pollutisoli]|uniref:hypothetical protein n=1 Tax=Paraflavitalea pollutisoli TaxID=3034143 RepID=UPI0023ED196B|nr:hypothetical protein [Paraflavitalea sp. H1-2-19X]
MQNLRVLFFISCLLGAAIARGQQAQYLIEAEDFQFKGGWVVEREGGKGFFNNSILRVMSGKTKAVDALTVVAVKQAGNYQVWVRAADYPNDRPGTRLFRLSVNDQIMPEESGRHGKPGFYWEQAGTVTLPAGNAVLRLNDSRGNFGRCDAIILSAADGFDPNAQPLSTLTSLRVKPVVVQPTPVQFPQLSAALASGVRPPVASIQNDEVRVRFMPATGSETKRLVAKTDIRIQGKWGSMDAKREDHKVYIIRADDPQLGFGNFFPSWNGSTGLTSFENNGHKYSILETDVILNPFFAGQVTEAIPVAAKQLNAQTIEVNYTVAGEPILTGTWSLAPGARHVEVNLQYKPQLAGYYSMGLAAFQSIAADSATNILLPPMFQYQRLSPQPVMVPSGMMPQPVSIAEMRTEWGLVSTFASGLARSFAPNDWGSANGPLGFTVKNESNRVQPVAFSPILGQPDSKLTAGSILKREFAIGAFATGWNEVLTYVSDSIYRVTDYRKQDNTSLTETAFNMVELMKNDSAAGWDAGLKGFYDIEANPAVVPTVVHASPLTLVSVAVMTKDEDFYLKRALPTIEYTLSRSGFRWAKAVSGTPFNSDKKSLQLSPFGSQFTTNYYEGLNRLLGEANPWLREIALPGGAIRPAKGYSVEVPTYTQELAAWRLTGDQQWLNKAKVSADRFIALQVNGAITKPLSREPFYNTSFYAYWWDMIDIYEATQEKRFLEAAESSAYHTVAGIRSYPQVKDTLQVIHPGNQYEGNTTLWWKGDKRYRLGFPRVKGDAPEKQVPQWLVSPVGLGFEQPFTYFDAGKTVRPVFMSSWAPHLLRLHQYSQQKIFLTYARNAVIGRFSTYPGYYASGFTDITHSKDFPYKGPDVSSIYYHHIPPHLAFTLDYLITEAITRSNGKVQFPFGKQDGFVWFNNRAFGAGKGTVFGDQAASLWMKRGLVTIDRPGFNYVTAISDDRFWILVMNEGAERQTADISLGVEVPVAATGPAVLQHVDGSKQEPIPLKNRAMEISVPAKGMVALSVPLKATNKPAVQAPVQHGMQVIDLGAPYGKCYVFRIRSPFGWDSIYGYLEAGPVDGASISFSLAGTQVSKDSYPYEWSVYKLPAGKPLTGKLQLKGSDGKLTTTNIQFE